MTGVEELRAEARAWFAQHARPRETADSAAPFRWGSGSDSVALFANLSDDEERALLAAHRGWLARKADAGLANVAWEQRWGGRDLTPAHALAVAEEERRFEVPLEHEQITMTVNIVAPTIRALGTAEQHERFLRRMLRGDDVWCQLFSEPDAGSDLAGLRMAATRTTDGWVLSGQKVWSSGARFADWGFVLCRTDPDVPKHEGITAFLVPMDAAGIEVRPLRQMTGGATFNEVFFTDVAVPDENVIGGVGGGWRAALTTLGYERAGFGGFGGRGRTFDRLRAMAQHFGRSDDPVVRQQLARAYTHERLIAFNRERAAAKRRSKQAPGPEGSLGKIMWTQGLQLNNETAELILGARFSVDTGEWGTFAWSERMLGTAGFRVAGGTDEIQRNVIAERVLGLPAEPRTDRDVPFRDVPH